MTSYISLLRGINVGGAHIIPMKELRTLLEENGYVNVRTYIQSGNVVYEIDTLPKHSVDALIEKAFGFRPAVLTLDAGQFRQAAANNPYETDNGKAVHLFFCNPEPADVNFTLLESLRTSSEQFRLIGSVFYIYAPDGIGRSKLLAGMQRAFPGVHITGRNLNTINRLLGMLTDH